MGIIITLLVMVNIISFIIAMADDDWPSRKKTLKWACSILSLLVIVGMGLVKWQSYANYVHLRATYDATVEQYATAVEMYEDKAVIDVERAAFTDLKYQGYQENIASFIVTLRSVVSSYNRAFISKREYHGNWFFSTLVVPPGPDMKLLSMRTAKDHPIKGE